MNRLRHFIVHRVLGHECGKVWAPTPGPNELARIHVFPVAKATPAVQILQELMFIMTRELARGTFNKVRLVSGDSLEINADRVEVVF